MHDFVIGAEAKAASFEILTLLLVALFVTGCWTNATPLTESDLQQGRRSDEVQRYYQQVKEDLLAYHASVPQLLPEHADRVVDALRRKGMAVYQFASENQTIVFYDSTGYQAKPAAEYLSQFFPGSAQTPGPNGSEGPDGSYYVEYIATKSGLVCRIYRQDYAGHEGKLLEWASAGVLRE